ncbi:MAG: DNA polymerase III subunit delta [Succinivibrio sp.]
MALAPVYVFASDDTFLKKERSEDIIKKAREQYPDARLMLFTGSDFSSGSKANLAQLENELMDGGLLCFSSNIIIKIYLDSIKSIPLQVLHLLAGRQREGVITIVDLPRVPTTITGNSKAASKDSQKPYESSFEKIKGKDDTKAKLIFSWLKQAGAVIENIYTPTGPDYYQWLLRQAKKHHLAIEPSCLEILALSCEGNLMLAEQFFSLVEMTVQNKTVTLDIIEKMLNDDSRYTGFDLAETILKPDSKRALKILSSLSEGAIQSQLPQILSLTIANFDKVLYAIKAARSDINTLKSLNNYQSKMSFFRPLGISVPSTMDEVIHAARKMPESFYSYLVKELNEASKSLCIFDYKGALSHLQNMAVSVSNAKVRTLEAL